MARVTAVELRGRARKAMLSCGGRGFMRFLPEGSALMATDAVRRCTDEADRQALIWALECAGFCVEEQNGLLLLTPQDALLESIGCGKAPEIGWTSLLHPAQALAARWLVNEKHPLTADGRRLILETLRLTWQQEDKVLAGLSALRAQAAVMQRRGDRSGLYEAGAVLALWCERDEGGCAHEA